MTISRAPATDLLVARQPVYDPGLRVVAYELLLQRGDGSSAIEESAAAGAVAALGLSLVMGQLALIPVSRAFLLDGHATALPSDRVVLRVPSELGVERPVVDALRELAADGYQVAVDFRSGPTAQPLVELADIAALDLRALDRALVREQVAALRARGISLLAQNVEHHETLEFCQDAGFDLLQGYFFCRPRVVAGQGVPVNVLNRIKLVATLQSPDVPLGDAADIISRDVGLSYNLLRFINSAFFSLPRRVESIRDAVTLLGVVNVRRWASLMALAEASDKPQELVVTGLVRARMCELLAIAYGHDDAEGFVTTGLFSVVDALTDTSMVELLASIPLSEEIIKALLNHEGAKGRILRAVIAYERGHFGELADLPPTPTPLAELYAQSVAWATEAWGTMRD